MAVSGHDSDQPGCDRGGEVGRGTVDLRAALNELREEIFLLETLMETIPDSIYFKDLDSRFTRVNRYTAIRLGASDPARIIGKTDFDFFTAEHAEQAFRDEQAIIRSGQPIVGLEEKETLPGGGVRWVSTTKMPLRDTNGAIIGTFGISRDITEKKRAEEQLERQAFYDLLTQLANRRLFLNRLEHVFARARRASDDEVFAVIYLDVDRFKAINDGLGHQAGDELLVQIARRLEKCVRPTDTLARLGGDEFTVLLENIRNVDDAVRVADRIQRAMTVPFELSGSQIHATASLGIADSGIGYQRPGDILRDADTAMYRAKAKGRSRYEVFEREIREPPDPAQG